MSKKQVQYVVKRGIVDKVDYNGDGFINENDDFVFKYVNGKEVSRMPLNAKVQERVTDILNKDIETSRNVPRNQTQRIIYTNMPHANTSNPPPVVFKDDTGFVQSFKQGLGAGVGVTAGNAAVEGIVSVFDGFFSSGGGAKKRRANKPRK